MMADPKSPKGDKVKMENQTYFHGIGRRKAAVARVRLLPGNGAIIVNGTPGGTRTHNGAFRKREPLRRR